MHAPNLATTATVDAVGTVLHADVGLTALLDVDPDELVGRPLASLGARPPDAEGIRDCVATAADGLVGQTQVSLRSPDDDELHVQLVATATGASAGSPIVVAVIDETSRVQEERDLASSQRRWQSLVRNAADIVFTIQDDGSLTSVTSALPRRFGWDVDDVIGVKGLEFVHPDDLREAHAAWLAISERTSAQETLEVRLVHADGTVSWSRLVITDLRDDADVRAVVGNATDITDRKLVEMRHQKEQDRFRARFDQSRLPQTLNAMDGTLVAANDAFCALMGLERAELIGQPLSRLVHEDDDATLPSSLELATPDGPETRQVDRVLRAHDQQPIPVRADVTAMRDDAGQPNGWAAVLQDLRPLKDSERARLQLQQFFDAVAERSHDFVVLHDADGNTLYASPPGLRMFGRGYDAPIELQKLAIHPDDRLIASDGWKHVQTHSTSHTWRFRARDVEGDWRWIEQTSINLLDTDVGGILSTIRDVSAEVETQSALAASEARYRAMAETAEEGIIVISPSGEVTYANARICSMLGIGIDDAVGVPVWEVFEGDARAFVAERVDTRSQRGPERYQLAYHHPDGSRRTLWVAASPMPDLEGRPQGSLAMISDITESLLRVDELRHAAEHDPLTGLPNRTTLTQHLDSLHLVGIDDVAVLFVDLDHFKDVNDGRGHTAGDDILVEVAARLGSIARVGDLVTRFGGDEFVVVMHDVDEQLATDQAAALLEELSRAYAVGNQLIRLGASIGVAMSPAPSSEDLLRFADAAMYAAKADGRGRVRVFDAALAERSKERYVVSSELLEAIESDALEMHYQPVVDVSTGEVVGVEALARWHHPTFGEISPERFVALAELSASAGDVDRWVVRRALRDVSELKADHTMPDDAYVAINLSSQSLSDERLAAYIVDAVQEAGLEPGVVMIEITESAIMTDKDVALRILQDLRARGFDIALDDFGTGYSSMTYLRDLPISVLKIDRSFVSAIPDDAHSLAIVRSLIELARSLDLKVVAEGVETQAHLDVLRARGCGLAQGWLWSPAVSVATLRSSRVLTDRFPAADVVPDPL